MIYLIEHHVNVGDVIVVAAYKSSSSADRAAAQMNQETGTRNYTVRPMELSE